MLLSTNITGTFILIATGSLFTILVFFFLLFMQYVGRRAEHSKQLEQLRVEHEQILMQSQLEIQEHTLRSISQEIHDNIGQALSLVALNLNTLEVNAEEETKITNTRNLVDHAIDDLRALSKMLLPERVKQVGLYEAISTDLFYIENSGKYVTNLFRSDGFPDFPANATIILYRIIQEILNNIIKHAKANKIFIKLLVENGTTKIIVEDDGIGFDTNSKEIKGIGLNTITYRAGMSNAKVEIESELGKGTRISIVFNQP